MLTNDSPNSNFCKAEKIKSQSALSKALTKSEDITERFLLCLFDISTILRIIKSVFKIVLFSIADDWFSLITYYFACDF